MKIISATQIYIYDFNKFYILLRNYIYDYLKILLSAKQNYMWLNKKFYMINKQIFLLPILVLFGVLSYSYNYILYKYPGNSCIIQQSLLLIITEFLV